MVLFLRKARGSYSITGIGKLSIITLITGLASALASTVWAVYMDGIFHNPALVGFVSAFFAIVSFFSFFAIIPAVEKSNKARLFSWAIFTFGFIYLLFAITRNAFLFIFLGLVATIVQSFQATSFGIIVKDKSEKSKLSRNEGLVYTFFNIAFFIGPLIAGFIASKFSVNFVFVFSAFFLFLSFSLFKIFKVNDSHITKKIDGKIFKNFIAFFKSKNRIYAYFISGGVNLWWVLIYLFMPLIMIRKGLDEIWIGYFLFAVVVPLILFEYAFSKSAGKSGFKRLFFAGYGIAGVCAFIAFFLGDIYFIMGIMVFASIGIAMIEPTSEAYFFDILKKGEDNRFYGPYNTTIDVNNFIGKILSSVLLIFLPFNYIFILFAFMMFFMSFLSLKTKKIVETQKRSHSRL